MHEPSLRAAPPPPARYIPYPASTPAWSLPPLATSVPPVVDTRENSVPPVDSERDERRDAPQRRAPSFAVELCLLALCAVVWLAGESHRFPAIQQGLIHNAFETAGGARFGAAIPTEPARLVQSASGAVKHGLDRFVHEWTMGLAGEMSRHEKAELDELRREVNAARMRAFRVIGALHAREVAQHDYILNRLAWRDWRARRVIASYDAAPPERVQLVLAEAARATCGDECLASLTASAPAPATAPTPKLRPSVEPVLADRRGPGGGGSSWTMALAAPAYARPSLVERDGRACRNWPVSCRVPAS